MTNRQKIINRIFEAQGKNGFWKVLPKKHKYYPDYMHYVPNFKSTLWTLILLADLECNPNDSRVKKPLEEIKEHFYNPKFGIYSLKEDHFPIPCLNGNLIYLDNYFNGFPSKKSLSAIDFFHQYQRFDDGCYGGEKNEFCSNKSCYGDHSCYWGVVKLLKGISFIPISFRTEKINDLRDRCIEFVLLHKVCFSSHKEGRMMIRGMDQLTFPNMYKSDFLEILWLLKREKVQSDQLKPALEILKSKEREGFWNLEKKVHNLTTSVGVVNKPNEFVSKRAREVMTHYQELLD